MLGELLTKEECAGCRLCCAFEGYDLFDTPTITPAVRELILKEYSPEQRFVQQEGCWLLRLECEPEKDLYYCSLLDRRHGCIMGDSKPFECRIWPLRVMRREGQLVLTLSPVCPVVKQKPHELIMRKSAELAPVIFAEAKACPVLVRPYTEGYEILSADTTC